jgi:hypothetical protein
MHRDRSDSRKQDKNILKQVRLVAIKLTPVDKIPRTRYKSTKALILLLSLYLHRCKIHFP